MKWLIYLALVGLLAVVAIRVFGPREPAELTHDFDPSGMGEDLDAYFAAQESRFADLRSGVEKRVVWAGEPGERSEWVVVYIHGFSATSEEIRPIPDHLAKRLGANLVFTRLQGHGRSNDAMGEATVGGWMTDVAEALEAARRIGDRTLILSNSTGGTLSAAAALDGDLNRNVAGYVFFSPNFAINNPLAPALTWPAARHWMPLIAGRRYSFETRSPEQEKFWTTEYPSIAVFPMAALVRKVRSLDFSAAQTPALFWYSPDDQVVRAEAIDRVVAAWGGPKETVHPDLGPEDDPFEHVLAGAIMSPSQTATVVEVVLAWAEGL
ncbi:MAG: alpha/beta fold hydrolase [Pseudomonadota bacterium]